MTAPARRPAKTTKPKLQSVDARQRAGLSGKEIMRWEELTGAMFEEYFGPKSKIPVVGPDGAVLRDGDGNIYMQERPGPFIHTVALVCVTKQREDPSFTMEQAAEFDMDDYPALLGGEEVNPHKGSG